MKTNMMKKHVKEWQFYATNPLRVKTRTRRVVLPSSASASSSAKEKKEVVYLEATIENTDESRRIVAVTLAANETVYTSSETLFPDRDVMEGEKSKSASKTPPEFLLRAGGDSARFLFALEERDSRDGGSGRMATTKRDDELGTLEIRWVSATGEPGSKSANNRRSCSDWASASGCELSSMNISSRTRCLCLSRACHSTEYLPAP